MLGAAVLHHSCRSLQTRNYHWGNVEISAEFGWAERVGLRIGLLRGSSVCGGDGTEKSGIAYASVRIRVGMSGHLWVGFQLRRTSNRSNQAHNSLRTYHCGGPYCASWAPG